MNLAEAGALDGPAAQIGGEGRQELIILVELALPLEAPFVIDSFQDGVPDLAVLIQDERDPPQKVKVGLSFA